MIEEECLEVIGGKAREGKRPLERARCKCVANIKRDLGKIECGCWDLIVLAQNRENLELL
jgi:hypothetical protein